MSNQWLITSTAIEHHGYNVTTRYPMVLQQLLGALTPKETALLAELSKSRSIPETWIPYHLVEGCRRFPYISML